MGFLHNRRRRGSHRRRISGTERMVGWLVLLLLVGIAVAVYLKGQHYESSRFALDASLLEKAPQVSATVESTDPADDSDAYTAGEFSGTLPPDTPGWSLLGTVEFFSPDTLYEKIDGYADQYLSYGFRGLEAASLAQDENPERFLDIFIYDMSTEANAAGILAAERSAGEPMPIGDEGYTSGSSLYFRRGPYYNQILAVDDVPEVKAAVASIAQWIDHEQLSAR